MKKRLLSILMAVALVATALTACGSKDDDKGDKNVESVDDADKDKDDSGDGYVEKMEGPIDDGMIEVQGEVTHIGGDEEPDDWSQAYDDYFSREGIISEHVRVDITVEDSGIVYDMTIGSIDENVFMLFDFNVASLELYAVEDVLYACTKYEGEESWIYAPLEESDNSDGIFNIVNTDFAKINSDVKSTYLEEVVENGVVYDVLEVEKEEDGVTNVGYYYIDRETQMIYKMVATIEGADTVCYFAEMDSIELPAEAANATEGTEEDIVMALLGVMFMSAGM